MTKREKPTHKQIIDAAEHFYGQRITPDRQFIIVRSASCISDHVHDGGYRIDYSVPVWCQLAHEGRAFGSLFWCDCPCHQVESDRSRARCAG